MAMGSYSMGAIVRIPLQVTEDGMAVEEYVSPKVKSIIRPNGTSAFNSPQSMVALSEEDSTYSFDYTPDVEGDYVVIITYTLEETEFTVIENFTVSARVNRTVAPRAESR